MSDTRTGTYILEYQPLKGMTLEFHPHGRMLAFFSKTDDRDDQGFRVYGVMRKLDEKVPTVAHIVGVTGLREALKIPVQG